MARLTSLLHNNPSHMAQREAEAAVQEKLEGVQEVWLILLGRGFFNVFDSLMMGTFPPILTYWCDL